MHANQITLEQAAQFASANTPRGWLRLDAHTVRGEQHLYLQQPAYGTNYLIGKIQIEALIAARRRQQGTVIRRRRAHSRFAAALAADRAAPGRCRADARCLEMDTVRL
jgi:hypothetical protein